MAEISEIEHHLVALLRQAIAEAEQRGYERGMRETIERIQSVVSASLVPPASGERKAVVQRIDASVDEEPARDARNDGRQRAPRGLVRTVIQRALKERPGLTPKEMEATARTADERMISSSSYRSELRIGRKAGRYREDGGRWYLAGNEKAEDSGQASPPPSA